VSSRREPWHGTTGGYTNHACRCRRCSAAWSEYSKDPRKRDAMGRKRAEYLSRGLNQNGKPRTRRYDLDALALMERYGATPDPRFL
jgi:hypothetical protein